MVQQFKEREVQQSGQVPGYQNVNYPPDAFGAAAGRALQGLGDSISNVGQIVAQVDREKKVNDVLDTTNKVRDALRPVLYDPNSGIYAKQGKNAMDASAEYEKAAQPIYDQYIAGEKDPQKRQMLEKLWSRESDQNKDKVAVHQLSELGKYKTEVAKATMLGSMEDAYNNYNDDKSVQAAIDQTFMAIETNSQGLPPEALDLMKKEARSNIRLSAISRWASEDPSKALEYYEAHKADLSGKDHVAATALVKAARKSQTIAEEKARIVNGGGDDFFESRIIPAESSNNPNAVSPKNAVGLSQLTLPTARDMMRLTGDMQYATLNDQELAQKLKDDPALNVRLGKARWNQQLNRLNGDVEAALVAYNAGPAAADAFLEHNAGKSPGERDFDVPGWQGIKNESEAYVKKILGSGVNKPAPSGRMTADNWTLKNFKPEDLTAPTPGGAWVDARAATALDNLTTTMKARFRGFSIRINEERDPGGATAGRRRGTSDPKDNPHVSKSQHLHGTAFDVQVQNWTTEEKQAFIAEARKLGFKGFGFYGPRGHLHIDMGAQRTWGRVPAWATEAMRTPVGIVEDGPAPTAVTPTGVLGANENNGYFIDTRKSALSVWMAQAETIEDPDIRRGVIAGLKVDAATLDQARDAELNAVKQGAWEHLANGGSVKDFRPDELARMDPSFINTLSEYEAKQKRGDTTTDWTAFAQLQSLTEEELVKTDIMTEYATKLGPTELKQELIRQREARKALMGEEHDKSLLANSRSRKDIIDDIKLAQGWTDRANGAEIANFNKIFGERILGAQAEKKDKLTEIEMQDIADKLLIEDKFSPKTLEFWQGRRSQGMAVDASDPDTFVAASTWEEVQPDDQKTLIDRFERIRGRLPDEEEATDVYNRAMRVWLGGAPDGPDDEKKRLRDKVEKSRGPVTDDYFEAFYGNYLLSFLGR